LASKNIAFHQFKDQVIFHKDEIVKADKKAVFNTSHDSISLEKITKYLN
jgi:hypothetical protein